MSSSDSSSRRGRVIVVAHSLDARDGGMETVHVELIRHCLAEIDVVAVSCRLDPSLVGQVEWHRVPVPERPAPVRFALFFVVASLILWRLRRPHDVIHTCGAIVANRIALASVHTVSAAVVAARGGHLAPRDVAPMRRMNSGLLRLMALFAERFVYRPRRVALLAAVSTLTATEIETSYPGVPVVVTPNGVDADRFHPDEEVRASMRAALGLGDGVVALFVGGDFDRKGLGVAIESLVTAESVTLVAVGAGDLSRATSLAEGLGVADRVRLLGPRRDVDHLDQMADLYVCASLYEADSLALLEAAATGLALVSTPVGSAEALLGRPPAAAGLVVERTPAAIGEALELLAGDPALRVAMGALARQRALERSWPSLATQMLGLYRALGEQR